MLKILEVCTASHHAHALVFNRALALNQKYPGTLQIDMLCGQGPEVEIMRKQNMHVIVSNLHRSLNPLKLIQSLVNLLQVIREHRYDVIHLHFGVPSLVGRILAIFIRRPIWIYQSHGYSIAETTGKFSRTIYLTLERMLKHTVAYALFQSEEDMHIARQYNLLKEKQMIYLGNGIDTRRFIPANYTHFQRENTVFGMVARFETIKNHQLLIDAIKHLRLKTGCFKVYMIGEGELQEIIQAQIVAHELDELVEILPYTHNMPDFYQRIDVGILTSLGEGLPRALLEPMACGKPVICTDVKGSREVVKHGKTGFITKLDEPNALAERMLWFIEHPIDQGKLGRAARQHILSHYSEQQVLKRLAELYLLCYQKRYNPRALQA